MSGLLYSLPRLLYTLNPIIAGGRMPKVLSLKQALKVWTWTILGAIALLKGGSLSDSLVASQHASTRWLGVAVAALSQVPWIVLVAWGFSIADEYQRQIGLVSTAIAFVGYVLLYVTFAVIQNAHLIDENFYLPYVPVAGLMWLVGFGLAKLYYRLRP